MKIVISNTDTGEIYDELDEVTSSQVAAYSNSNVLVIDEKEYVVDSIVMEHNNQKLIIMVIDESSQT
jgi:hypothetical protein